MRRVIAKVHSFTHPDKTYTIKIDENGGISCDCMSYRYFTRKHTYLLATRSCKHTDLFTSTAHNMEVLLALSNNSTIEIKDKGETWVVNKIEEVNK